MPDSTEELVALGHEHLGKNELDQAEAAYNQALELDRCCSGALWGRGYVQFARGNWSDAFDDLFDAERFGAEGDLGFYRTRAIANYGAGFGVEDRLADAERVTELEPDDPQGWFYRGNALCILGEYEAAIESLNRAIELQPDYGVAHYYRGEAWKGLGCSMAHLVSARHIRSVTSRPICPATPHF